MKNMLPIDLTQFKAVGDKRTFMNALFDLDGYLAATQGHYLVVDTSSKSTFYGFPKFEDLISPQNSGKLQHQIHTIITSPEQFIWVDMPEISEDLHRDCRECNSRGMEKVFQGNCPECDGDGNLSFENEHNSYEVECKSCDGRGEQYVGLRFCSTCAGTKKHVMHIPIVHPGLGSDNWCLNGAHVKKFSSLAHCQIAWVDEWQTYAVKFDGGVAIILPMRK